MKDIGIVGNGFVGNAIYQNLKNIYNVKVYDIDLNKSLNQLNEVYECDLVFVCLPTPMISADGGKCNLSIVDNFFKTVPNSCKSLFVIKSTIPIGTTQKIRNDRKDLKICHNPEFLTAANAVEDFKNSDRNIIGGDLEETKLLHDLLFELFPNSKIITTSSDESETIKYFSNVFLATKVAFFNILFDVSNTYKMNYDNLIFGICTDNRIGFSHSKVPGPDGDRGFGGTCFPKDINSLIFMLNENQLNYQIFNEVWNYNKNIRNNWDWSNNPSSVNNKE
jgi:UDPglucose 6-dehydrogenase